jgi:5-hydroxyisourate hydrolase-like protein (transthyretin family)
MTRVLQLIVLIGVIVTARAGMAQVRDTRSAPAAAPPAPVGTAVISGLATSEDGSRPVRFAYVLLIGTTTGLVKVSSTDGDGKFAFASLPPDRYTVGVSKPPYIGTIAGSKRPGRPGTPIVVAAGQKVGNIAVRMPMGAVITGVITDEKGSPAANAGVALQQWRMQSGERTLVSAGTAFTDERGRYRFHGLMPGEYLVSAYPVSSPVASRVLTTAEVDAALRGETPAPAAAASAPLRYALVYFPGTPRSSDATPILLATAEERQNVDFRLGTVTMSRVEGTVGTNDGQPLAQARILVVSTGSALSTASMIAVGPDGRFSFTNAPGRYAVTVTGTGAQQGQFASAMVELAGADVFGLQLLMRPTMTVNGQLAFEGRATAPSPAGRRIPFRQFGSTAVPTGGPVMSATSPTGTFTVTGLVPGRYQIGGPIGFGPTADTMTWALKSVTVDGTDITDQLLEVSGEAAPKNIVVTYTDQFQELSGRLQSQSGAPASDYTILVFPEDKAYWIHGSRRIVTTRPGTDGRFTLSGAGPTTLPPGRYLLAAVTDLGRDEQFDPAFLGQVVPAAIPITLGPGEKKTQDLAIK